jgi:hypothetical protein
VAGIPVAQRFTVQTITFEPTVRARVAAVLRRLRTGGMVVHLPPDDGALLMLWCLGGFHRGVLMVGIWTEMSWPIVRDRRGRWWTLSPTDWTLHAVTMIRNLTEGVEYASVQ